MLTVMCPNCRHRFPAPGCCNPDSRLEDTAMHPSTTTSSSPAGSSYGNYYSCGGGLMMPRSYGSNCIINAPTIIHGPTIIQSNQGSGTAQIPGPGFLADYWNISSKPSNSECKINTTCDLTGGTVTITTPNIQSGGYLLQPTDSDSLIHSPRIEIRPKLSGGGCLVQKRLSEDNSSQLLFSNNDLLKSLANFSYQRDFPKEEATTPSVHPPSGCQELPGMRRDSFVQPRPDNSIHDNCNPAAGDRQSRKNSNCCCSSQSNSINNNNNCNYNYNSNNCSNNLQSETCQRKLSNDDPGAVQIKVSATIQLPANVDQCTLNITATKSSGNNVDTITTVNGINSATTTTSEAGNCILVQMDTQQTGNSCENERREDTSTPTPTTPVSWLMPVSYNYDEGYSQKRGLPKTTDIKKLLSSTGWYYEGMNWQQSENLLKNMEIGRWLVRDSSDSRFVFAISVQTDRGPTSVRVHFYNRNFRLDSEPQLIMTMPQFDCPIKLLDYYIYVSKHGNLNGNLKQVWVDLTGHLYSKIYLTKPVVKDVGTLSHLARLVINKHKIDTKSLPIPIKNYIAEYPYTF